jgi:hypothetical protein
MPRKKQKQPPKKHSEHKDSVLVGSTAWIDVLLLVSDIIFKAVPGLHSEITMKTLNSHTLVMLWTWPVAATKIPMLMLLCKQFNLAYRKYHYKQYEYGCWVLQRFWNSVVSTATVLLEHTENGDATVLLQCGDTVLCEVRMDHSGVENGVLQVRHSYTKFEELSFNMDVFYDIDYDSFRDRLFTMYFESRRCTACARNNPDIKEFYPRHALRDRLRVAMKTNTELKVEPRPTRSLTFHQVPLHVNDT